MPDLVRARPSPDSDCRVFTLADGSCLASEIEEAQPPIGPEPGSPSSAPAEGPGSEQGFPRGA